MESDNYFQDKTQESRYFSHKINKLHLLMLVSFPLYTFFGGSTAYGYGVNLGLLVFFLRGDIAFKDIFVSEKKMTLPLFFIFLILMQPLNLDAYIFAEFSESFLNMFGLSAGVTPRENLKYFEYVARPFSEVLLFGFFGPVMEEMIVRGYIMGAYHRYSRNKGFALLFTAIIFAANHCNLYTSVPIFFNAFIMGYVAMEYGIVWTMIYHSIENFLSAYVFADVIVMKLPVEIREPVAVGTYLAFTICSAVIVIVKRKFISEYIRENIFDRQQVKSTLRSIPFILYIAFLIIMTVSRIEKFEP